MTITETIKIDFARTMVLWKVAAARAFCGVYLEIAKRLKAKQDKADIGRPWLNLYPAATRLRWHNIRDRNGALTGLGCFVNPHPGATPLDNG